MFLNIVEVFYNIYDSDGWNVVFDDILLIFKIKF